MLKFMRVYKSIFYILAVSGSYSINLSSSYVSVLRRDNVNG